jgi:hypothetical protein
MTPAQCRQTDVIANPQAQAIGQHNLDRFRSPFFADNRAGRRRWISHTHRHEAGGRACRQTTLMHLPPPGSQHARINIVPGRDSPTVAPGSCDSATIRSFSVNPQRRRRSLPLMISIVVFDIALSPTLQSALRSTPRCDLPLPIRNQR